MPARLMLVLVTLAGGSACDARPARQPAGTSDAAPLRDDGRIVLAERDTAVIGRPNRVARGSDGSILVSDFVTASVLRFDQTGAFIARLGRKGGGPGEFVIPSLIAQLPSATVVLDSRRGVAQYFDAGGQRTGGSTQLGLTPTGIASDGDTVWVGGFSYDPKHAAAVVRFSPADAAATVVLPQPARFLQSPMLFALGGAQVAVGKDDIWIGFGAIDWLYRIDRHSGALVDSLPIPRRIRRGVPLADILANKFRDPGEFIGAASAMVDVSVAADGSPVVLHWDITPEGSSQTGKYYLSVIRKSRPCVDIPVPLPQASAPRTRLVGDMILVLNQIVDTATNHVTSQIDRYSINLKGCSVK